MKVIPQYKVIGHTSFYCTVCLSSDRVHTVVWLLYSLSVFWSCTYSRLVTWQVTLPRSCYWSPWTACVQTWSTRGTHLPCTTWLNVGSLQHTWLLSTHQIPYQTSTPSSLWVLYHYPPLHHRYCEYYTTIRLYTIVTVSIIPLSASTPSLLWVLYHYLPLHHRHCEYYTTIRLYTIVTVSIIPLSATQLK